MAKTYPPIDQKDYATYERLQNFVPTNMKILIRSIQRSTTSGVTPGWPKNIRENDFQTQTVYFESKPRVYDPFKGDKNYPGYRYIDAISGPAFVGPDNRVTSAVEYKALLRMYDEIPQVTANLALLYAERKKTAESIALALGGILKCVRDVKKGRVPELFMDAKTLRGRKKFTGAWLNYTYGIKPFASDLRAIAISELAPVVWLSGSANDEYSRSIKTGQTSFIDNMGSYRCKYKGGLSLANPLTATLAGAGLTNPALIAWELTPFSFMADWLIPVGPYLEMLGSTSGYTKHSGSITRTIKESFYRVSDNGATASGEWKRITRSVVAFPNAPLPRFKNPYSPVHALNTLSIIHQMVKDKR